MANRVRQAHDVGTKKGCHDVELNPSTARTSQETANAQTWAQAWAELSRARPCTGNYHSWATLIRHRNPSEHGRRGRLFRFRNPRPVGTLAERKAIVWGVVRHEYAIKRLRSDISSDLKSIRNQILTKIHSTCIPLDVSSSRMYR